MSFCDAFTYSAPALLSEDAEQPLYKANATAAAIKKILRMEKVLPMLPVEASLKKIAPAIKNFSIFSRVAVYNRKMYKFTPMRSIIGKHTIYNLLLIIALLSAPIGTMAAPKIMRSVFEARNDYLLLPMASNAKYTKMSILTEDGQLIGKAEGLLSASPLPEWYAPICISPFKGKKIIFEYEDTLGGLSPHMRQDSAPPQRDTSKDAARPAFHLAAPNGCLGSPAALIRMNDSWHAFWLYNPFTLGPERGMRALLHAVSNDLLVWKFERPIGFPSESQLWPDGISNGSAFFDAENKSGFFDKNGGVIFSFELPKSGTALVRSADLVNFEAFSPKIAIPGGAESSQIFYNPDSKLWMILRSEKKDGKYSAILYFSKKLDKWEKACRIDSLPQYGNFQMRKIPMSGSPESDKWVLMDGNGAYVVGAFEGKNFKILSKNPGKIFYGDINGVRFWENAGAGKTYASAGVHHKEDWFRRLGLNFTGCATLPYDLRLARLKNGEYQLRAYVPEEICSHIGRGYQTLGEEGGMEFAANIYSIPDATGNKCMYQGRFFTYNSENFCIEISESNYMYNYVDNTFTLSRYGDIRSVDSAQTPLNRYIVDFKGFVDTYDSEFIMGAGEAVLVIGDAMLNNDQQFKVGTGRGSVFTDYIGKFPIFKRSDSRRINHAIKDFLDLTKELDTAQSGGAN